MTPMQKDVIAYVTQAGEVTSETVNARFELGRNAARSHLARLHKAGHLDKRSADGASRGRETYYFIPDESTADDLGATMRAQMITKRWISGELRL